MENPRILSAILREVNNWQKKAHPFVNNFLSTKRNRFLILRRLRLGATHRLKTRLIVMLKYSSCEFYTDTEGMIRSHIWSIISVGRTTVRSFKRRNEDQHETRKCLWISINLHCLKWNQSNNKLEWPKTRSIKLWDV
jgi:hypothetical protein